MDLHPTSSRFDSLGARELSFSMIVSQEVRLGFASRRRNLRVTTMMCTSSTPTIHIDTYDEYRGATYTLSIAETFTRPGHLFLNRPLVSALEDLHIPASAFLKLQRSAITDINVDKSTYSGSRRLMRRYGLDASPLQTLINTLDDRSAPTSLLTDDRFLRRCMEVLVARILGDIKTSARIPLPGCYHLVGVPDTDSLLAFDEIYACVRDQGGQQVWLEGKVAMTRSPTCSPGDVRIVNAVGRWKGIGRSPRYAVLTNCVVLPTVGELVSRSAGRIWADGRYRDSIVVFSDGRRR